VRLPCGWDIINHITLSLTAAHCIVDLSDPKDFTNYRVSIGRHNITDPSEKGCLNMTLSSIYHHKDFKENAKAFKSHADIAILKLSAKVDFTDRIQPSCMPHVGTNTTNITGYLVGHGKHDDGRTSDTPKETTLHSVHEGNCIYENESNYKGVSKRSFCAKSKVATACNGDSGSGYYVLTNGRFETYGIVSQGLSTVECKPNDYTVFVDVPGYMEWIYESEPF
jgi:secreted trypsin-like serine protease